MKNALGAVQSALVLGGGSEIAHATMRALVPSGCRTVVLAARQPDQLSAQVGELTQLGATTVHTIEFDAADIAAHASIVDKCFADTGDIDLVVLAFGVLGHGAGIDTPPEAAADAVITNYVGAVSSGLAVARRMREQGHGTIGGTRSRAVRDDSGRSRRRDHRRTRLQQGDRVGAAAAALGGDGLPSLAACGVAQGQRQPLKDVDEGLRG